MQVCHWHWSDYTRAVAAVGRRASLKRRELLMRSVLATMTTGGLARGGGGHTISGCRIGGGGGGDSFNLSGALHVAGLSTIDGMDGAASCGAGCGGGGGGGIMSTHDIDDDPLADILAAAAAAAGSGGGGGGSTKIRTGSAGGVSAIAAGAMGAPHRARAPIVPAGRAGSGSSTAAAGGGGGLGMGMGMGGVAPGSRAHSRQALSHHLPGGPAGTTSAAQRQLLLSTLPGGSAATAAAGGGPASSDLTGSAATADGTSSSIGGLTGDLTAAAAAAAAALAVGNASTASTATTLRSIREVAADPARHSGILAQPGSRVKAMAFDGGCRLAAVLLYDSSVSVWDVETGRTVSQLIRRGERDKHTGGVTGVAMSRDGATCVTMSRDKTARVWDVKTGECVRRCGRNVPAGRVGCSGRGWQEGSHRRVAP